MEVQYSQSKIRTILILSANPQGTSTLRLDKEIREIREGLRRAKNRDQYKVEAIGAVQIRDIHRAIQDYDPHIIHFSGHGVGEEGLVFEDEVGQAKLVDADALAGLFKLYANQVECVVLNACYSEEQAQAIAQHILYVLGMRKAIQDKAAIEFAVGFYDGLADGRSYQYSYNLGCALIRMAGIQDHLIPQLIRKKDYSKNHSSDPLSPTESVPSSFQGVEGQTLDQNNLSTAKEKDDHRSLTAFSGSPSICTQLYSFLEANEWKDADQETLRVILEVTGHQEFSLINRKDIQNFDTLVFNQINQLWLYFSQGKFGFSVQREIWSQVGGSPGKYPYPIFCKFGKRVGWHTNGNQQGDWLRYEDFAFVSDAPAGHFPSLRLLDTEQETNWWGTWERRFVGFLTLSESCFQHSTRS